MANYGGIIAFIFVLVMGVSLAVVIWANERRGNKNTNFNAESARRLSKEWDRKDTAELNRIEKKIKQKCRSGKNELTYLKTPRTRVVECLKNRGYKVTIGYAGAVIEWKEEV